MKQVKGFTAKSIIFFLIFFISINAQSKPTTNHTFNRESSRSKKLEELSPEQQKQANAWIKEHKERKKIQQERLAKQSHSVESMQGIENLSDSLKIVNENSPLGVKYNIESLMKGSLGGIKDLVAFEKDGESFPAMVVPAHILKLNSQVNIGETFQKGGEVFAGEQNVYDIFDVTVVDKYGEGTDTEVVARIDGVAFRVIDLGNDNFEFIYPDAQNPLSVNIKTGAMRILPEDQLTPENLQQGLFCIFGSTGEWEEVVPASKDIERKWMYQVFSDEEVEIFEDFVRLNPMILAENPHIVGDGTSGTRLLWIPPATIQKISQNWGLDMRDEAQRLEAMKNAEIAHLLEKESYWIGSHNAGGTTQVDGKTLASIDYTILARDISTIKDRVGTPAENSFWYSITTDVNGQTQIEQIGDRSQELESYFTLFPPLDRQSDTLLTPSDLWQAKICHQQAVESPVQPDRVEVFFDNDGNSLFFPASFNEDGEMTIEVSTDDLDLPPGKYTPHIRLWSQDLMSDWTLLPEVIVDMTTFAEVGSEIPTEFRLTQNYPNPFNPSTTIAYSIPVVDVPSLSGRQTGGVEGPHVSLIVYDLLGKEIAILINKQQQPGNYQVEFDANELTSGIYFYKLTAGNFSQTRKMLLVR